ncbi:caspase-3-like [Babylonia areolata]|uniref:caspase-3-like n=1 Tax=Babylonia areolata TaxID=304850 RepID=UPI003FD44F87
MSVPQEKDEMTTPNKTMDGDDSLDAGGADSTDVFGRPGSSGTRGAGGGDRAGKVEMPRSQFDAECYNMNHKRRGDALIINNREFSKSTGMGERTGTDTDRDNMYMVLSEMGFSVNMVENCTAAEMESALMKASKADHSDADCFACVILSHGEEGYVYGTDRPVEIDRLVAPFKGHRCKTLAGKPKLFFIQACRGSQLDVGVDVADAHGSRPEEEMETDEVEIRRIPTEADFLMAYSVVPGYYSWRNSANGSWFIQALFHVLRDNWKRMELLSMMTKVCRKVAFDFESNASHEFMRRKKQIPCITSMLTREVYFTPKK